MGEAVTGDGVKAETGEAVMGDGVKAAYLCSSLPSRTGGGGGHAVPGRGV